jgi:hypothetical protein
VIPRDDKYHREVKNNTTDLTETDATDREIISFVTKGYSSSYSIWSAMKKEAKEKKLDRKVMTYRNTNKRVVRLSRLGLLEENKPEVYSVHGKRDYKLTMKGLEQLIPYILNHLDAIEKLVEYMDRFELDKEEFGRVLKDKFSSMLETLTTFEKLAGLRITTQMITHQATRDVIEFKKLYESAGYKFATSTREMEKSLKPIERSQSPKVKTEIVNRTSSNRYEELFKIIYENKDPNARYEAAKIIIKTFQELRDSESNENNQKRLDRRLNKMNEILERYRIATSQKDKNMTMNEFYKTIMKDFKPELERKKSVIDTIKK